VAATNHRWRSCCGQRLHSPLARAQVTGHCGFDAVEPTRPRRDQLSAMEAFYRDEGFEPRGMGEEILPRKSPAAVISRAYAASGHATAAPPTSVMNSRRFMCPVPRYGAAYPAGLPRIPRRDWPGPWGKPELALAGPSMCLGPNQNSTGAVRTGGCLKLHGWLVSLRRGQPPLRPARRTRLSPASGS
jgi:hypothetical protein